MATTKIWAIKDSLRRVIDYAANPDKTDSDLAKALHYAENKDKTALDGEKTYLTTAINCDGDPLEAMLATQKYFGKTGGNVAYHAYQSFKPGEVTPEQCHKIGVQLAKKMWGDRFQVLVASHLNCQHLHNHYVICSVSFRDGKKYDCKKSEYYRFRDLSDKLCFENDLSVIENPDGKTPRNIYFAEKAGEPTKYNLMRQAVTTALRISTSWWDFEHHLRDLGYEFDRSPERKYPRIKRISDTKWTRIYRLGENHTLANYEYCFLKARAELGAEEYKWHYWDKKQTNGYYREDIFEKRHREALLAEPSLIGVVLLMVYLLGGPDLITPENPAPKYKPLTPAIKQESSRAQMYSRQADILGREHLRTEEDVSKYLDQVERKIHEKLDERRQFYNHVRRETDPERLKGFRLLIKITNDEIKKLRLEKKDLANVLERSGVMKEQIEAEYAARREKIAREYYLTNKQKEDLGIAPPPKERIRYRDWEK